MMDAWSHQMGRFGVISVQRDLLQLFFAKSIPGNIRMDNLHLHLHLPACTSKKRGLQMRQKSFAYLMIPNGHGYGAR
jgi:hypothetical protein